MTTSLIDADSLLALDIGSITTRALFFDVVDGRYRFMAVGTAPTTAGAPFHDIGEGVRRAVDQLQAITGRTFIGADERMIIPSQSDHEGVDTCVAILSAGQPMRIVVVGLLEDISAESAERLARTTYSQVVDRLNLADRRKGDARIDALIRLHPDLVIIAGGTEGGASHSLMNILESVGLACYLMPAAQRPEVLFAGNQSLVTEVENALGNLTHLTTAPNIRPALDVEQLTPAALQLSTMYRTVSAKKIPGITEVDLWTGGKMMPAATAFGRMIRFLSTCYDPSTGVLGVDVGASASILAAAHAGDLSLGVYPELGQGETLPGMLRECSLADIVRWIPFEISETGLRNYIYNKALRPYTIPATPEDLSIEQALVRQALQIAVKKGISTFPGGLSQTGIGNLPGFEPIVAAGSALTRAPNMGQSMLMLLDGLQPAGITTLVLDQNNITGILGAAAGINAPLTAQILDTNNFVNLGLVVAPVGNAPYGAQALIVKITYEDGSQSKLEVKHGALEVIPIASGQKATLQLQPVNRFDVGKGPGAGRSVSVKSGGLLGVVIDARGRPLQLPGDSSKRFDLLKKWRAALGG